MANYLIPLIIILYILLKRFENIKKDKEKKLTPISILIIPIIYIYAFSGMLKNIFTLTSIEYLFIFALATLIGAFVGFYRANLYKIHINNTTKQLTYKSTMADLVMFIVLIIIKIPAEILLPHFVHGNILLVSLDALILFSLGSVIINKLMLLFKYLKAVNSL